jgi:hypothetical protein
MARFATSQVASLGNLKVLPPPKNDSNSLKTIFVKKKFLKKTLFRGSNKKGGITVPWT